MNIIVCVKQVPEVEPEIDFSKNTIMRENTSSVINPFDLHALEEGIRIKEKIANSRVTALSMGIVSVVELLRDCLSIGADKAILLNDKCFAGADTLATVYALAKGIKKIHNYDLIICGKQAVDGDTAHVGPGLAGRLGIPHATNVNMIKKINDSYIICHRLTDYGFEVVELKLPALITVVKDINEPRIPSIKDVIKSQKASIKIWNADDIRADKDLCGLQGSPTQVVKLFKPVYNMENEIIKGNVEEQVAQIVNRVMSFFPCKEE